MSNLQSPTLYGYAQTEIVSLYMAAYSCIYSYGQERKTGLLGMKESQSDWHELFVY